MTQNPDSFLVWLAEWAYLEAGNSPAGHARASLHFTCFWFTGRTGPNFSQKLSDSLSKGFAVGSVAAVRDDGGVFLGASAVVLSGITGGKKLDRNGITLPRWCIHAMDICHLSD
jgi:hypothetical protein